jgi:hypothetical protein
MTIECPDSQSGVPSQDLMTVDVRPATMVKIDSSGKLRIDGSFDEQYVEHGQLFSDKTKVLKFIYSTYGMGGEFDENSLNKYFWNLLKNKEDKFKLPDGHLQLNNFEVEIFLWNVLKQLEKHGLISLTVNRLLDKSKIPIEEALLKAERSLIKFFNESMKSSYSMQPHEQNTLVDLLKFSFEIRDNPLIKQKIAFTETGRSALITDGGIDILRTLAEKVPSEAGRELIAVAIASIATSTKEGIAALIENENVIQTLTTLAKRLCEKVT